MIDGPYRHCRYCDRLIVLVDGVWTDPDATGDDAIWGPVCDRHDTFTAEHEPTDDTDATVVWDAEHGWHDGPRTRVRLDDQGRITTE